MELQVSFPEDSHKQSQIKVLSQIGQGKFSIFEAFSPLHNQTYALKVFPKNSLGDKQFQKEQLLSHLNHHNVIKNIPITSERDDCHLLLLEHAKYGDFFDIVLKGALNTEALVRTYFHQLLEGLEHIHSQKIAHLDLKLENLMMSSDLKLKIIDFDQAQLLSDEIITSAGTKAYRAPEVKEGTCNNFTAADVFSAGILLFTMMTKEFPFMEARDPQRKNVRCYPTYLTNKKGFWQVASQLNNDPEFLTQDFRDLVDGMVNEDPEKRLTINEIKNSNWYKGRVMTDKDLQGQMKLKLETIRRQKRRV